MVLFDRSKNTGSIDVKMYESVLEEKSSFKMWGLTFFSRLDWGSYIISIAKFILNSFYEVSFSRGCSVSLQIHHTSTYEIQLSHLGWCP